MFTAPAAARRTAIIVLSRVFLTSIRPWPFRPVGLLRLFHEAGGLPPFGDDDGSDHNSSNESCDEDRAWRVLMAVRLQHNDRYKCHDKPGQPHRKPASAHFR